MENPTLGKPRYCLKLSYEYFDLRTQGNGEDGCRHSLFTGTPVSTERGTEQTVSIKFLFKNIYPQGVSCFLVLHGLWKIVNVVFETPTHPYPSGKIG